MSDETFVIDGRAYRQCAIPAGLDADLGRPSEAWTDGNEIVVQGDPSDEGDHNCDAMGCGGLHVLDRLPAVPLVAGRHAILRLPYEATDADAEALLDRVAASGCTVLRIVTGRGAHGEAVRAVVVQRAGTGGGTGA